jgi:hypothetical protein
MCRHADHHNQRRPDAGPDRISDAERRPQCRGQEEKRGRKTEATIKDGTSRVNPSDALSADVPGTSAMIAMAR